MARRIGMPLYPTGRLNATAAANFSPTSDKELLMSEEELKRHIHLRLNGQERVCAVTGLHLQFDGEFNDSDMLASLDRIDSSGHYEIGNLQVVYRFINRW